MTCLEGKKINVQNTAPNFISWGFLHLNDLMQPSGGPGERPSHRAGTAGECELKCDEGEERDKAVNINRDRNTMRCLLLSCFKELGVVIKQMNINPMIFVF